MNVHIHKGYLLPFNPHMKYSIWVSTIGYLLELKQKKFYILLRWDIVPKICLLERIFTNSRMDYSELLYYYYYETWEPEQRRKAYIKKLKIQTAKKKNSKHASWGLYNIKYSSRKLQHIAAFTSVKRHT